jgi:hypothetical protein
MSKALHATLNFQERDLPVTYSFGDDQGGVQIGEVGEGRSAKKFSDVLAGHSDGPFLIGLSRSSGVLRSAHDDKKQQETAPDQGR